MKSRNFVAIILTMVIAFAMASCGKKDPTGSGSSLIKSSKLIMKANTKQNLTTAATNVPVPGGELNVQTALFNVEKFRIEENSGYDGEQQGDHQDNNDGSNGAELEAPDIYLTGPFTLDVSSGEAIIDSVSVYPGTFKKVDLKFSPNPEAPFNNKSIIIEGAFTAAAGSVVAFSLQSEFLQEIQTNIAGTGITVAENATVPVVVIFDLAGFFSNVDFGSAKVVDGKISIDSNNNAALLNMFEANLGKYVDAEGE